MKTEAKVLIGTTIIGIALLAGLIIFNKSSGQLTGSTEVDTQVLIRDDSYATSTAPLKVNIVEFGDYECPACAYAHPVVKKLLEDYKGRFNFVFRNFPLPQHSKAIISAEASEAAGEQGKFWEMHNKLYENQEAWVNSSAPLDVLKGYAQELGLNVEQFTQAITTEKYKTKISRDRQDGINIGVNSTPTFYVNNKQFKGALSYGDFAKIIEEELNK